MRNYMAELSAPRVHTLDTTVRVSCTARPAYPHWMERVLHPGLQYTGPAQYDLGADVIPWRHERQKGGTDLIHGKAVYEYLEAEDQIGNCLGLLDREEIKKMGAPVFREVFGDRAVLFFLRSTIIDQDDFLHAPYLLLLSNNEMKDGWYWLGPGGRLHENYFMLRFRRSG